MSRHDSDQTQGMTAPEQTAPDKPEAEIAQGGQPVQQTASGPATEDASPDARSAAEQDDAQTAASDFQAQGAGPAETDRQPTPSGKRWNLPPAPSNPYLAGVYLGLTLLASYLILGAGLGASGALARLGASLEHTVAPAHTVASAYFGRYFPDPLHYYLVFMFAGTLLGGALSALTGARFRLRVERGPAAGRLVRLGLALAGGVLSGFAARLAHGCTSGQGLSGGALLLTGSMVFLACVFTAGYLTAWIFGRQWK
ncbi:hypothetical protein JCM15519_17470 [Fundidesulfovibrio butyratiphilus]